jgi:GTP-binding protein
MSKDLEEIKNGIPQGTPLEKIRNLAVVAHVDHGKSTLVNCLLQCAMKTAIEDRVMDSDAVEQARGITIFSKATSMMWDDHLMHIVDTPGHSDFKSQVENSLKNVNTVLLVVDVNGMEQQTKFVIGKAVQEGLKFIIFVNKLDRAPKESRIERAEQTVNEVLMYMLEIDENLDPSEVPILYGSSKFNYASRSLERAAAEEVQGVDEILNVIRDYAPAPKINREEPSRLLITATSYDQHLGACSIGLVHGKGFCKGDVLYIKDDKGEILEKVKILNIVRFVATKQIHITRAYPGEIVGLYANCKVGTVGHTACNDKNAEPIEAPQLEAKVISVNVGANKVKPGSYGGTLVTFRDIAKRLVAESNSNVSIDAFVQGSYIEVRAMGALQLGILFDNMMSEGYEFVIFASRVQTIVRNGVEMEPFERVSLEFNVSYMGQIMNNINQRNGVVEDTDTEDENMTISFSISSRDLLGFGSHFKSITKGAGIMGREIIEYRPFDASKKAFKRSAGLLIACESGKASAYALSKRLKLGDYFISPGDRIFKGQIIGVSKTDTMHINIVECKQLTNFRAAKNDEKLSLPPIMPMSTDAGILFIQGEERIFATPSCLAIMSS